MRLERASLTRALKIVACSVALICVGLIASSYIGAAKGAAVEQMTQPKYSDKQLMLPEGFHNWVFVGASIGLSYSEQARTDGPGAFHHIYIQPEAYAHFKRTGQFPEKTMLVMEVYKPEQKVSINKQGYFEGDRVALEVALKDHDKFEEGWAYFDFGNGRRSVATAFPKNTCWSCHNEHGETDNVFTQFYPILREAKKTSQILNQPDPLTRFYWDRLGLFTSMLDAQRGSPTSRQLKGATS